MQPNVLDQSVAINVTESAADVVRNLLISKNVPDYGLRVFVSGGGCSGMQYGMALEAAGDHATAQPLLRRALAIREQTLGPDHDRLALVLNNLGLTFYPGLCNHCPDPPCTEVCPTATPYVHDPGPA